MKEVFKIITKIGMYLFIWGPMWWSNFLTPINSDYVEAQHNTYQESYITFLVIVLVLCTAYTVNGVTNWLFKNK